MAQVTKEVSAKSKAMLFELISAAANKDVAVNAYVRGLADALELEGNWMFNYSTFSFQKQEDKCPDTDKQAPTAA